AYPFDRRPRLRHARISHQHPLRGRGSSPTFRRVLEGVHEEVTAKADKETRRQGAKEQDVCRSVSLSPCLLVSSSVFVVGAGGIGCAVGYALRSAHVEVTFVDVDAAKIE